MAARPPFAVERDNPYAWTTQTQPTTTTAPPAVRAAHGSTGSGAGGYSATAAGAVGGAIGAGTDFSSMSDDEINQYVREHFPTYSWMLSDPEIGPILRDGARQGISTAELESKVQATAWYKNTSATARQWRELQESDPATAQAKLSDKTLELKAMTAEAGINLDDGELSMLALQALQMGSTDLQIRQHILMVAKDRPGSTAGARSGGSIAANGASIKALAAQYLLPLSDQQAEQYATDLWSGTIDLETIKGNFAQQATTTYAGNNAALADAIARGITPRAAIDPQMQMIASTLEMGVDQINPLDPRWSKIINYDDGNGNLRLMTVPESGQWARQQKEYRFTQQANQSTDQRIDRLLTTLGEVKH